MTDLQTLELYRENKVQTLEVQEVLRKLGFTLNDVQKFSVDEIVEHAIFDIINPK